MKYQAGGTQQTFAKVVAADVKGERRRGILASQDEQARGKHAALVDTRFRPWMYLRSIDILLSLKGP
jgi:hypothetical protein